MLHGVDINKMAWWGWVGICVRTWVIRGKRDHGFGLRIHGMGVVWDCVTLLRLEASPLQFNSVETDCYENYTGNVNRRISLGMIGARSESCDTRL